MVGPALAFLEVGVQWQVLPCDLAMPTPFPNEKSRNRKASEMIYWPAASPFGEGSYPRPFGFALEAVAVRRAKQFVEGEDMLYVKAVTREAFHRTQGPPALHAPDPVLLKALPGAAGEVEAGASQIRFVHEEMVGTVSDGQPCATRFSGAATAIRQGFCPSWSRYRRRS